MFSIHIDTATTWRGGQNQVLLTVMGLRAAGHRAMLVAHPARRAAAAGGGRASSSCRSRPATSWISRPAGSSRGCSTGSGPTSSTRTIRMRWRWRPWPCRCPRTSRYRRWSPSRRVDFHLKRTRSRSGSTGRCDVHRGVRGHRAHPARGRRAGGADRHRARGHRRGAHRGIEPASVHRGRSGCHTHAPIVGNIGALVAHKGQRHLIDAARARRCATYPTRGSSILGEGELRGTLEHQVKALHLEKHVRPSGLQGRRARAAQGIRCVRDELRDRGSRHVDPRRDGLRQGRSWARDTGGIPEVVEDGVTGLLVEPRDPRVARPGDHDAAEGRAAANANGCRRAWPGCASTLRVDQMVAGHAGACTKTF